MRQSADFGRLITTGHFQRVKALLGGCPASQVHVCSTGVPYDEAEKFLPSILSDEADLEKSCAALQTQRRVRARCELQSAGIV